MSDIGTAAPAAVVEAPAPAPSAPKTRAEVYAKFGSGPLDVGTTSAEAEAKAAEPAKPAEVKPEPEKPDAKPKSAELAALARRDKHQREVAERRKAEIAERETKLAEREKALGSMDTLRDEFETSPVEALKRLGIKMKPAEIAKLIWVAEMGENAPKEYRQEVINAASKAEIAKARQEAAEVRAELKRRDEAEVEAKKQAEQAKAYEATVGEFKGNLSKAFDSAKDAPHLAALSPEDRAQAVEDTLANLLDFAQKNPEAELPSFDKVTAFVETQLAKQASRFKGLYGTRSTEQTGKQAELEAPTLSERQSAPSRPAASADETLDQMRKRLAAQMPPL